MLIHWNEWESTQEHRPESGPGSGLDPVPLRFAVSHFPQRKAFGEPDDLMKERPAGVGAGGEFNPPPPAEDCCGAGAGGRGDLLSGI